MKLLRSAIGAGLLAILGASAAFGAGETSPVEAAKRVIGTLPSLESQQLAALDSARVAAISKFPSNPDLQNQEYWKALSKLPQTARFFKGVRMPSAAQLKSLAKTLIAIAVIVFALYFGFFGIVALSIGLALLNGGGTGKPQLGDVPGVVGPAFPYSSLRKPGYDGPAPSMPAQDSTTRERIRDIWRGLADTKESFDSLSDKQRSDLMGAGLTAQYPNATFDFLARLNQDANSLLACTSAQKNCRTKERLVDALPRYRDKVVRAGDEKFGGIQTYEQVMARFKFGDQALDIPLMVFKAKARELGYPSEAIAALGGPEH